jgi:hypothetical protein
VTLYADSDGSGVGSVIIGSTITATNTTVRFNPTSYATTSTEVDSYAAKITGSEDIKAWVFIQGSDKVYDQTTTDTMVFKGDPTQASAVTLQGGTASFADKDAGVNKAVTYSGYSLGGSSSDLVLYSASGSTTATITPAPLAVSAAGIDKVYDATTSASVTLSTTALGSDVVSASYGSASFATANVGSDKPVAVVGISLTGADAGNYSANTTAFTTASITADPSPSPIPDPIPDPILNNPVVVPIVPAGPGNQAPLAMQQELRNGVLIPVIVPIMPSGLGLMAQTRNQAQSDLLTVIAPPPEPQMQSLFPVPVMVPIMPIAPILAPKPSRN